MLDGDGPTVPQISRRPMEEPISTFSSQDHLNRRVKGPASAEAATTGDKNLAARHTLESRTRIQQWKAVLSFRV